MMVSNGSATPDQYRHHLTDPRSFCESQVVVSLKSNGNICSGTSTVLCPPSSVRRDGESSNTLSSIWDIEVEPCLPSTHPPVEAESKQTALEEKKAPIVQFRRSHYDRVRVSKQLCSALKARDLSSCEISLCETAGPGPASRHASVSFGSLPGSSESSSEGGGEGGGDGGDDGDEDEDGIQVISESQQVRPDSSVSFFRRPSLLFHHSAESCSSQATATTETTQDHQRRDTSQMPIATALFVATCLGTPAIALTGLKLGMFAAVGGGIMGFATGKMFAEHEERQALIKGDLNDGTVPTHIKRKKTIKRIQEWEKFEESCHMLKEMDEDKILKISELQRERRPGSTGTLKEVKVKPPNNLRKAKSVSYSHQLSPTLI